MDWYLTTFPEWYRVAGGVIAVICFLFCVITGWLAIDEEDADYARGALVMLGASLVSVLAWPLTVGAVASLLLFRLVQLATK